MNIVSLFKEALVKLGRDPDTKVSLIVSCAPFWRLERYSSDPADLSNMSYPDFETNYSEIIKRSTSLLKPFRVSVFVIGNVRDSKGELKDLHSLTKKSLCESGNPLYVDAILTTALASAPMRASTCMQASKLVGVHQNVVCSCKDHVLSAAKCRELGIRPDA